MVFWRACSELETYRAQGKTMDSDHVTCDSWALPEGSLSSHRCVQKMGVLMQPVIPEGECMEGSRWSTEGSRAQLSHIRRHCSFTAEPQPQAGRQPQDLEGGILFMVPILEGA